MRSGFGTAALELCGLVAIETAHVRVSSMGLDAAFDPVTQPMRPLGQVAA